MPQIKTFDISKPIPDEQGMNEYFARKDKKEIGFDLMKLVDGYYEFILKQGVQRIWRRSFDFYYRGWLKGSRLNRTGRQDEYYSACVNEYRNIIQHLVVGVTSQRLEYEPKATNTDFQSAAQCVIANGVLEYYNRVLQLDDRTKLSTEDAVCYGEGYAACEWDANIGPEYGVGLQDEIVRQGDVVITNYMPADVVRDWTVPDHSQRQWYILRDWVNRYDMAQRYPDLADRLLQMGDSTDVLRNQRFGVLRTQQETNLIPRFKLFHDRTASVPEGRFTEFFDSDLITMDGPLPYDEVPVYRIVPDNYRKTPFGYSVAYELMPLQEILDGLYSIVVTNQATFGVQNIAMPKGASIALNALGEGLNLITYDPKFGAPQPLNLVQTAPEIFNFIKDITQRMETIAGLNSVVRGNPEASLKSGAALALVASQAIQFNSGLQQSYARFVENIGTAILNILKRYAKTPRMMTIAGKSNRVLMDQFKADDISKVSRVTVNVGNPISRTTAGKLQIADTLLEHQLIKTPEQYLMVASTGRLEPLVENPQSQIMLIRSENEQLSEGKQVQALVTDDHRLHILEHNTVLSSPESRQEPVVVQSTLAHIQEHINHLKTADPVLLALYGQPQVPQAPAVPPTGAASEVMNPTNPVETQAATVNMPNMPTNPLTGEQFNPEQNAATPPAI